MQQSENKRGPGLWMAIGTFILIAIALTPGTTQPPLRMLSDPEAGSYQWQYDVWASDAIAASRKCQQAAEQISRREGPTEFLPPPRQKTRRISPYGEYRWECTMNSSDEDVPYVDPRTRPQP